MTSSSPESSSESGAAGPGRIGLVLGAGGLVGLAYHAGVLRALERVTGWDPRSAHLIVGSSAGSVVAAYLRTGRSTEELWQIAHGTHATLVGEGRASLQTRSEVWDPLVRGPLELARRAVGSAYVLGRAAVRIPTPRLPSLLGELFPAGLFSMEEGRRRLRAELPAEWPDRPLWLCAVDITTGRRIALGRCLPERLSLADAVMASCAIPGVYRPVRRGRRTLVDGGVHSTSNLDLAVAGGCTTVVGIVPMAYDPGAPPGGVRRAVREMAQRSVEAEAAAARRSGCPVLLIRPGAPELRVHGVDLMRPHGLEEVARSAYDATVRRLEADDAAEVVARLTEGGQERGRIPDTVL